MAKISIDISTNLKNIEPKTRPPRRFSTGNSTIIPSEPSPLPNYLRASIGSCHDFCKYGIKRDFETKKMGSPSPKHDKNDKMLQKERSEKCHTGKMAEKSPKSVATIPKQRPKTKPSGTNTFSHRPVVKQGNETFLRSSSNIRISRNDANKDVRTSKNSKKSVVLPSSVKGSTLMNKTRKKDSHLESQKSVEEPETDQRKKYENIVPEKIIHAIELKDESQNEDLVPAENRNEDLASNLSSKQSQKMHSVPENRMNLRRAVSEGDFINQKAKNYHVKSVLRRGIVEERESNPNLMNSAIEEAASILVGVRKSKVKALVGAFESVIKTQDCGSSRAS